MGLLSLKIFYFFECGDCLNTSDSDVHRRQILTYENGPRAEMVNMVEGKGLMHYQKGINDVFLWKVGPRFGIES